MPETPSTEPTQAERSPQAKSGKSSAKIFGVWGLAIFSFSFLANVNATPQLAKFGLGSLLIFVLAIGLFLAPTAMSSAEMGTAWPRTGGIYVWTRLAFGEGVAFLIIWLEWANFVVAWPGIMGAIVVQSAYVIDPTLATNPIFLILVIVLVTWLAAGVALRGLRIAKGFAWYSVIAGTLLPAMLLVGFAVAFLLQGNPPAMEVSASALIPELSTANVAFISGALLMFSGIEIAAIHAGDVRDPGRTIPRANLIAVILCFVLFAPLTLALAVLIPGEEINIVVGLVQSAEQVFNSFNLGWLTLVFAFLLVSGTIAALIQIISGPSRGLMVAGRQGGNLPRALQTENRAKMPVAIILLQALISSVLALGYNFLGSVQNAWFMFLLIQTNMTLIMYLIMFAAVVKLRYSHPKTPRPYRIPGKKVGLYSIVSLGVLVCVAGVIVSFIPTEEAAGMPVLVYVLILFIGTAIFAAAPFVFWIFRKPEWKTESSSVTDEDVESVDSPDSEAQISEA